jgi:hypothetical protein
MSYKKVEKKFQKDLVLREDVLIIKYKIKEYGNDRHDIDGEGYIPSSI